MQQQWVLKSLTIWGVFITTVTGLIPAINGLLAVWDPSLSISPEWLAGLDEGVKAAIPSIGLVVGSILVLIDRLKGTGEVKKTLTLSKPEYHWED